MARQASEKEEFSTYHIVQKGNDRKEAFSSDRNKYGFTDTLFRMKNKYNHDNLGKAFMVKRLVDYA